MLDFLVNIFNNLLYFPLFNLLVLLYNYIPGQDFGLAIIFLTIIIRVILTPIFVKSIESQKSLQALQPKVQEIQKKHKDDKEKQAKEILDIYKKENLNPFSGIILALIQLPVLIALYQVFWQGLNPDQLNYLYSFVKNPGMINAISFSIVDLSKSNFSFALVAGVMQFFQTKMLQIKQVPNKDKPNDFSIMMQKQMTYIFPVVTVVILTQLPSALSLYWIVSGVFSIAQQYYVLRKK